MILFLFFFSRATYTIKYPKKNPLSCSFLLKPSNFHMFGQKQAGCEDV